MSLMIGAILIGADFAGRYETLLERIRPGEWTAAGEISIDAATRREFASTAAGGYGGKTLIIDPFWPYDCAHDGRKLNPQDERLMALSSEAPVLCFYQDETSMSFGFSVYQGGNRVRARKVDPEAIHADYGPPLPAEAPFDPASHDDSERIMALTAAFLGEPLVELIFANELVLTRYEQ